MSARYFGVRCPACRPLVGCRIRRSGSSDNGAVLDEYGKALVNANVGGDRWRLRHDAVLRAVVAELRSACQEVTDNVYALFVGKFGERDDDSSRRAAEYADQSEGTGDKRRRRKQGLVPDLLVEPCEVAGTRVVHARTLFELKQLNLVQTYFQVRMHEKAGHAVAQRATHVHSDYCRKLHEADRYAGTRCDAPRTAGGKCSYGNGVVHAVGGGERHLVEEFGTVQPLIFGHFGELNDGFTKLCGDIARSIAFQHHREHGWKNAKAGIPRARAGVMRRISMVVLRATARHVLRGLDIIGPQCVHARNTRRDRSNAEQADYDEFRYNRLDGAFARDFAAEGR